MDAPAREAFDQHVRGDDVVRVQEQDREQRPLLRRRQFDPTSRSRDLERSENAELVPLQRRLYRPYTGLPQSGCHAERYAARVARDRAGHTLELGAVPATVNGLAGELPRGLLIHVAGPTDEGIREIEIWRSRDELERHDGTRGGLPAATVRSFVVKRVLRSTDQEEES